MTYLIELLVNVKTFPVKLAQKIGLEESVVFSQLLKTYSSTEFTFTDTFSSSYGIRDINKCLERLKTYELLEEKLSGKYILNIEKLENIFYEGAKERVDSELVSLISRYLDMCKKKGRVFTKQKVLEQIKGKNVDFVKKQMQYSIDNQFITLYLDETNKGTGARIKERDSGGSTQSEISSRKRLSKEV